MRAATHRIHPDGSWPALSGRPPQAQLPPPVLWPQLQSTQVSTQVAIQLWQLVSVTHHHCRRRRRRLQLRLQLRLGDDCELLHTQQLSTVCRRTAFICDGRGSNVPPPALPCGSCVRAQSGRLSLSASHAASAAVLPRPRARFRCGYRPNRSITSLCSRICRGWLCQEEEEEEEE